MQQKNDASTANMYDTLDTPTVLERVHKIASPTKQSPEKKQTTDISEITQQLNQSLRSITNKKEEARSKQRTLLHHNKALHNRLFPSIPQSSKPPQITVTAPERRFEGGIDVEIATPTTFANQIASFSNQIADQSRNRPISTSRSGASVSLPPHQVVCIKTRIGRFVFSADGTMARKPKVFNIKASEDRLRRNQRSSSSLDSGALPRIPSLSKPSRTASANSGLRRNNSSDWFLTSSRTDEYDDDEEDDLESFVDSDVDGSRGTARHRRRIHRRKPAPTSKDKLEQRIRELQSDSYKLQELAERVDKYKKEDRKKRAEIVEQHPDYQQQYVTYLENLKDPQHRIESIRSQMALQRQRFEEAREKRALLNEEEHQRALILCQERERKMYTAEGVREQRLKKATSIKRATVWTCLITLIQRSVIVFNAIKNQRLERTRIVEYERAALVIQRKFYPIVREVIELRVLRALETISRNVFRMTINSRIRRKKRAMPLIVSFLRDYGTTQRFYKHIRFFMRKVRTVQTIVRAHISMRAAQMQLLKLQYDKFEDEYIAQNHKDNLADLKRKLIAKIEETMTVKVKKKLKKKKSVSSSVTSLPGKGYKSKDGDSIDDMNDNELLQLIRTDKLSPQKLTLMASQLNVQFSSATLRTTEIIKSDLLWNKLQEKLQQHRKEIDNWKQRVKAEQERLQTEQLQHAIMRRLESPNVTPPTHSSPLQFRSPSFAQSLIWRSVSNASLSNSPLTSKTITRMNSFATVKAAQMAAAALSRPSSLSSQQQQQSSSPPPPPKPDAVGARPRFKTLLSNAELEELVRKGLKMTQELHA